MSKRQFGPPWTPETIAAEAKRYRWRSEFMEHAPGAYYAARRRFQILEEVCAHMEPHPGRQRFWSRERVGESVAVCGTLEEFRTKYREAYNAVVRNGWRDLIADLPQTSTPPGWWTKERVAEEAKKYTTRVEFQRGSPNAYHAAHRKKWMVDVCAHMQYRQRPAGYWTRQRVMDEAQKYASRSEFQQGSGGAYTVAAKEGLLDEASAHMVKKGSRYERALYAFEFEDHSVYVGLTFDYDVRYTEHRTQNKRIGQKLKKTPAKYVRFNEWLPLDEAGEEEARLIEEYGLLRPSCAYQKPRTG